MNWPGLDSVTLSVDCHGEFPKVTALTSEEPDDGNVVLDCVSLADGERIDSDAFAIKDHRSGAWRPLSQYIVDEAMKRAWVEG